MKNSSEFFIPYFAGSEASCPKDSQACFLSTIVNGISQDTKHPLYLTKAGGFLSALPESYNERKKIVVNYSSGVKTGGTISDKYNVKCIFILRKEDTN